MTPRFFTYVVVLVVSIVFGAGCSVSFDQTPADSSTRTNSSAGVSATLRFADWKEVTTGVEVKQERVSIGVLDELFTIVRIDPTQATILPAIDTENPSTVETWQERLQASVVINAGYFDEKYNLTTRTVLYGESFGPLLTGTTALFRTINGQQWSIVRPDDATGDPRFSVQSYPLLVKNGEVAFVSGSDEPASRTIVATDANGMVYFIITEFGVLSLKQLAEVLHDDLSIALTDALNLDGGTSSGIAVSNTEESLSYTNASALVPSVLYVP